MYQYHGCVSSFGIHLGVEGTICALIQQLFNCVMTTWIYSNKEII